MDLKVRSVPAGFLAGPLRLLGGFLRDGEPLSEGFVATLARAVERGDLEIFEARVENRVVGVLVLNFRLNVSLGGTFASVEDLYVEPGERRGGVGRALVEAARRRSAERGVSYVEVLVEEEEARKFYAALGFELEEGVRVLSRSWPLGPTGGV